MAKFHHSVSRHLNTANHDTAFSLILYTGCSDVTKLDSIYGSEVESHSCTYCNRKTILCRLSDADWQRHIDKYKSLGTKKCPYKIPKTD